MQKQKENLFSERFRLLNSQEKTEEIKWSSSESSDYENVSIKDKFSNVTNKPQSRKRKRKKKIQKNISNLNITITDIHKDLTDVSLDVKSSVIDIKDDCEEREKSPIFGPTRLYFPPEAGLASSVSPILISKTYNQQTNTSVFKKSPILTLKYGSPKVSPKVKKKLFHCNYTDDTTEKVEEPTSGTKSFVMLNKSQHLVSLDRRKDESKTVPDVYHNYKLNHEKLDSSSSLGISVYRNNLENNRHLNKEITFGTNSITQRNDIKISEIEEKTSKLAESNLVYNTNTSFVHAKRNNTYFDSHFSSENTSQQSISDVFTTQHSSKTSDEIDIITSITQVNPNKNNSNSTEEPVSKNQSPISSQSAEMNLEKTKKVRYKKNGLAYRLNALLKKQTASISLWQHERYLAENSNFVIPKGEHLVFRIQKVQVKYGCFLLEAVDAIDQEFLILINSIYVSSHNISPDIFKLYEPYKIVDYKIDCKLITNVCKFEFITLK